MRRPPSLTSLRLFMQVAHHRSFSEAGRVANISQPALSRTIKLLEEELGVRLLDRNSRNVTLTTAGEALLPVVERLTADFDGAFHELAETFSGARGRVVVGVLLTMLAKFAVMRTTSLTIDIEPRWVLIALAVGLLGGSIGALYPALRAARQDAVEALSYE